MSKRTAYSRYLDAKAKPTPNGKLSSGSLFDMQRALLDALRSGQPLPIEMQRDLAFSFEELVTGNQPELLTVLRGAGKPDPTLKRYLRKEAIRYLRWVSDGRINDKTPLKTVARSFGVTAKAVETWIDAFSDTEIDPLVFESPDLAEFEDSDGGLVKRDHSELVKSVMIACGNRYRIYSKPLIAVRS
ncbi:MAG: hypothetical protein IPF44_00915 [Betaproteobacteria bacterium]|nr:hypothetical protein [Betaproteobacteria bacterium]MBP8170537.1 hypothetical protein [Azonexus sp.]